MNIEHLIKMRISVISIIAHITIIIYQETVIWARFVYGNIRKLHVFQLDIKDIIDNDNIYKWIYTH